MVDQGPWGLFWEALGAGTFDLGEFRRHVDAVLKEPKLIKGHIDALYKQSPKIDTVYVFILLPASAFGGKAIEIKDGRWKGPGFRDYWLPTATSVRRSHINPMQPMPEALFARLRDMVPRVKGVRGLYVDAATVVIEKPAVVYIDPQYEGTTDYSFSINAVSVAQNAGCPSWISEGRPMSADSTLLTTGRASLLSASRTRRATAEYLSFIDGKSPSRLR